MVSQLHALRDALIEAGASEEKANAAAQEVAAYYARWRREPKTAMAISFGAALLAVAALFALIYWILAFANQIGAQT